MTRYYTNVLNNKEMNISSKFWIEIKKILVIMSPTVYAELTG